MDKKYIYKGTDITIDIIMKVEHVVRIIAQISDRGFDECYRDFLNSKTYSALQNTESVMWAESAEFIVAEYYRENAKSS